MFFGDSTLSRQSHWAAVIIQRHYRGHACRRRLWSYGGEWFVHCVVKVQCAYRIRLALRETVRRWQEKVLQSVHKIHSLFHHWKSRKLRLKIRALFLKKCVTKLQSAYRRKIASRLFYVVQTMHREKMALRLQCALRRFLGYRRALHRRRLRQLVVHAFNHGLPLNISQTEAFSASLSHSISHTRSNAHALTLTQPHALSTTQQRAHSSFSISSKTSAKRTPWLPFIDFSSHSAEEALVRVCAIMHDLALRASFSSALQRTESTLRYEFIRRNLLMLQEQLQQRRVSAQFKGIANEHSLRMTHSLSIDESEENTDNINFITGEYPHSIAVEIAQQSLCSEPLKRSLLEVSLFLSLSSNWSKCGRTRQLHVSLLERCVGFMTQKLLSSTDRTLFEETIENVQWRERQRATEARERRAQKEAEKEEAAAKEKEKVHKMAKLSSTRSVTFSLASLSLDEDEQRKERKERAHTLKEKEKAKEREKEKPLSPWDSRDALQRTTSALSVCNTINTASCHESETESLSLHRDGQQDEQDDALSLLSLTRFRARCEKDSLPVRSVNGVYRALRERETFLELKKQQSLTLEDLTHDETDLRSKDHIEHDKEEDIGLFPEDSVQWQGFSMDALLGMFFQATTLSRHSFVRTADALLFKADVLLLYALQRLALCQRESLPPRAEQEERANGEENMEEINGENDDDSFSLSVNNKKATEKTRLFPEDFNFFLPFFAGYVERDATLRRLQQRIFRLLSKAKSLAVPGSLDEFEMHFRGDLLHALYSPPVVLFETQREFLVPIVNVLLPNAVSLASSSKDNVKVNANTLPVVQNDKKKMSNNYSGTAKDKRKEKDTPKTTSPDHITISATVRVILAGNVLFVTGFVRRYEDIVPPPSHQRTQICTRLVDFFKRLGGVSLSSSAAANAMSGNITRENSVSSLRTRTRTHSSSSFASATSSAFLSSSRQPSVLTQQSSFASLSQQLSVDETKSQFPLSIRPMILFPSEASQLVSLFQTNVIFAAESKKLDKATPFVKVKTPNESLMDEQEESRNTKRKKKLKKKHATPEEKKRAIAYESILRRYPQLGESVEDFVRYIAEGELNISLVYQFHALASQLPRTESMDDDDTRHRERAMQTLLSSAQSISSQSTPGKSGTLSIVGDSFEPVLRFHVPFLDTKREQLLANNDTRYATILLQRVYRGYVGRKRFQYVLRKKKEITRRRWLAWKVVHKLRIMRALHECSAVLIQSRFKGWRWRKHLRLMNTEILKIQCAFRQFRARQIATQERARRNSGPQVLDMLPGGRLIVLHDRKLQMKVYRCGENFKFRGIDVINGELFYGKLYSTELRTLLRGYNTAVQQKYIDRGELPTCIACKHEQVFPWQFEKITELILSHLNLVHTIDRVTRDFFLVPGEEKDRQNLHNDLTLIVQLARNGDVFNKLQAKFVKKEIDYHPFLPYLKEIIHEEAQAKLLIGNSKNRKNLIRAFNQSNSRRGNSKKKQSGVVTLPPLSASSSKMMSSSSDRFPFVNNQQESSKKMLMAGKLSLQPSGSAGSLASLR